MKRTVRSNWHGCPIRYAAAMFGDEWKLLILRDLALKGCQRYSEFANSGEGIASNVLATRLAELERDGIIYKVAHPTHSARSVYSLTEKGVDLIPVLLAIIDWSAKWDEKCEAPDSFLSELRENPAQLASKIFAALPTETQ